MTFKDIVHLVTAIVTAYLLFMLAGVIVLAKAGVIQ